MHHVTKAIVEGFWGTHDFELDLFPEVTFLIGQNGTGKTTLINLIAAVLTIDFRTLEKIAFKRIVIVLNKRNLHDEPRITVQKIKRKDRPYELIEYRIKPGEKNSTELKYSVEDIDAPLRLGRQTVDHRALRDYYRFMPSQLSTKIQELVTVNWLSVHRTPTVERTREERSYESTVDQRLETISNDLVRFFSTLSKRKDEEVRLFQESLFISLIEQENSGQLFNTPELENLSTYVASLDVIFKELHVSDPDINQKLKDFEKVGLKLKKRLVDDVDRGFAVDEVVYLLSLQRISSTVDRWNRLQERLDVIFAPRDKWLKIANDLFQRKKMELNESNELQFSSRSGKSLKAQMLSSGEKQLLILLSETLLQREQPAIFIADEPELSLHVLWQEKLVESLRALNPAAQIIAATHSPDIVGALSNRTLDMETIIP